MNFFTRLVTFLFICIIIYKTCLFLFLKKEYNIYSPPKLKTIKEKTKKQYIKQNPYNQNIEQPLFEFDFIVLYDFEPVEFDNLENENLENQNVHDNKIQRSLRKEFEKINNTETKDNSIFQDIIQNAPDVYKENIEKIAKHIIKSDIEMVGYNDEKLKDIVEKVYMNLQNQDEINFFYDNLNDCIDENNKVVCATGIVSRLLSTRFLNHPEKFPKSENYIFQEMLNTASQIRKEESNDDVFKEKFKQEIEKTYSDILTMKEIDEKVAEICNNL